MIIFGFTLTSPVLNATAGVPAQDATVLPTPTWQAYLQDCGLKAIDANEARSTQVFEANYKGKTIHWSGKLDTIKPGWWGKYTILVLMDPTESVMHELDANNGSDLSLTVPATFKKLALSLNKGDMIIFDGTIDTQGGHFSHHTITVTNLTRQDSKPATKTPESAEVAQQKPTETRATVAPEDPLVLAEKQFRNTAKQMDNCDPNNGWGMVQFINHVIQDAGTIQLSWSDADDLMLYGGGANSSGNIMFSSDTRAAYRNWRAAKLAHKQTLDAPVTTVPVPTPDASIVHKPLPTVPVQDNITRRIEAAKATWRLAHPGATEAERIEQKPVPALNATKKPVPSAGILVDANEGYYTYQRSRAAQLVTKFNQINATLAEDPPVEKAIPLYKSQGYLG